MELVKQSIWQRQSDLARAVMVVEEELWLAVVAELSGERDLAERYLAKARERLGELEEMTAGGGDGALQ